MRRRFHQNRSRVTHTHTHAHTYRLLFQEAQFEQLTRELEAERQSVANQLELVRTDADESARGGEHVLLGARRIVMSVWHDCFGENTG